MSDLTTETCEPCSGETDAIEGEELEKLAKELDDRWKVEDEHHLQATFEFEDFVSALEFTNEAGRVAEGEGHHPEICLTWGEARIRVWTHAIDALSRNDFILAAKLDELVA